MRFLLDTHTILWYVEASPQLSNKVKNIIGNTDNTIIVSMVSFWELGIKSSLGKLELKFTTDEIAQKLVAQGIELLPVSLNHIRTIQSLPHHHRDPFDRMLIAQADTESCTVLTRDEAFNAYAIAVLW